MIEEDLSGLAKLTSYQHDLFMPIEEPFDANSRETIRDIRDN